MPKKIKIYTDGACSGNPGIGGWASILLFDEGKQKISGSEEKTTNNRMELLSAIEGIKLALILGYDHIEVYSDSAYVINSIVNPNHLKKWSKNGWKKSDSITPIKNQDLWKRLILLLEKATRNERQINYFKVKGHSGDKYNEMADELAKKEVKLLKDSIA